MNPNFGFSKFSSPVPAGTYLSYVVKVAVEGRERAQDRNMAERCDSLTQMKMPAEKLPRNFLAKKSSTPYLESFEIFDQGLHPVHERR